MNKKIGTLIYGKNNSLSENIAVCFAAALAAAFMYYDHYNGFAEILRIAAGVLLFASWFFAGFSSGKKNRFGFLFFAVGYWLVPNIYMLFYASRDNLRGYSKWLSFLNKAADILANKPFSYIAEKLGSREWIYAAAVTVISVSAYFIGKNLIAADKKEL